MDVNPVLGGGVGKQHLRAVQLQGGDQVAAAAHDFVVDQGKAGMAFYRSALAADMGDGDDPIDRGDIDLPVVACLDLAGKKRQAVNTGLDVHVDRVVGDLVLTIWGEDHKRVYRDRKTAVCRESSQDERIDFSQCKTDEGWIDRPVEARLFPNTTRKRE